MFTIKHMHACTHARTHTQNINACTVHVALAKKTCSGNERMPMAFTPARAHTHSLKHSHSLSPTLYNSLSLIHTHTLFLSHSHTLPQANTHHNTQRKKHTPKYDHRERASARARAASPMHSHTYRKGVGWWGKRKIGDWDNTSPAAFQHVPDKVLHCPKQPSYAQSEWKMHTAVAVGVQTHAQNKSRVAILLNMPWLRRLRRSHD